MNKHIKRTGIMVILTLAALGSCNLFMPGPVNTAMLEDVEELQGLLPAFEAAMTLVVPDDPAITDKAVSRTFTPGSDDPETPADCWSGGPGVVRYPASGYMEDFYGTQGNSAYLKIEKIEPAGTLYNVKLYIYPTLSSSVEYVFEEYLVAADSWTPVNTSGVEDYTAYINYETHHFDGPVEDREVIWTRYVDNKYYDAFDVPGDPEDPAYDYPSEVSEPEKLEASSDEFSSHTTGKTFADNISTTVETTFTEFYTEIPDTGISGVSYIQNQNKTRETVRRFSEHSGKKIIRARTELGNTLILEITSINSGIDRKATYFNETKQKKNGTAKLVKTLRLTETEEGSNKFTGTLTVSRKKISTYDVTLDSVNGLVIYRTNSFVEKDVTLDSIVQFEANERKSDKVFTVSLDKGSIFTGSLYNGKLTGTIERGTEEAGLVADIFSYTVTTSEGSVTN